MATTDALPFPRKNVAYRVIFPILDADGDLVTAAAGLDSEVSKDQGTFTDCTNEATEIATSSGMYYLDLTSTEMNADCVAVIVKTSTSGAKTTPMVIYPMEDGDLRANVVQYNSVAGTFASGRPEVNVSHFGGSAGTFASGRAEVNTSHFGGTAGTFASGRPETNASHIAGSAVSTSSAQIGVNVVNAGGTAWGSGAITAASIATDAITAAKLASDAGTEIAAAVWDRLTSALSTASSIGKLLVDNVNATISSRSSQTSVDTIDDFVDTEVAAIKTETDKIASIKTKTDSLTFTTAGQVDATAVTVSDKTGYRLSATGVDDILDEAITEPTATFTWNGSLRSIVGWLGALGRNKITQSASTQTLRNDADSGNISTSSTSESAGTFTRAEWS